MSKDLLARLSGPGNTRKQFRFLTYPVDRLLAALYGRLVSEHEERAARDRAQHAVPVAWRAELAVAEGGQLQPVLHTSLGSEAVAGGEPGPGGCGNSGNGDGQPWPLLATAGTQAGRAEAEGGKPLLPVPGWCVGGGANLRLALPEAAALDGQAGTGAGGGQPLPLARLAKHAGALALLRQGAGVGLRWQLQQLARDSLASCEGRPYTSAQPICAVSTERPPPWPPP